MQEEAQKWLRSYYSKKFTIDVKEDYSMSVRERSAEDEQINMIVTDHMLERSQEMQIDMSTTWSYSQVVQRHKKNQNSQEE